MKPEQRGYQWLRKHITPPSRVDRIENLMVLGMPDVNIKLVNCPEFWVEIKAPNEPVRTTTPLIGGRNHGVSQDQKNWFLRQHKARGHAFFLLCTNKRTLLVPGLYADELNSMTLAQVRQVSRIDLFHHEAITPEEFTTCLRNSIL